MKCRCTGAEMAECHEVCAFAGHEGGICEQCDDGDQEDLNWWSDDE